MRRQDTYVGLIRCTVVVCAIGFAWASFAVAEEPTNPPAPSDQSVQERAVPRKGFGQEQHKPRTNNQVMMQQRAGGLGAAGDCTCLKGSGGCALGPWGPCPDNAPNCKVASCEKTTGSTCEECGNSPAATGGGVRQLNKSVAPGIGGGTYAR